MREELVRRLTNIGVMLSQTLHVLITLGDGDPKMTTSARIGRQVVRGSRWAIIVEAILSFVLFDDNHCVEAYLEDQARRMRGGQHDTSAAT